MNHLSDIYQSASKRLSYGNSYHYQHLNGPIDASKSTGSRLKQRIIAGTIVSAILIGLYLLLSPSSVGHDSIDEWWNAGAGKTQQATCEAIPDKIRVAVIETVGTHDEVHAALLHSAASQPNTDVDLYTMHPRYGISKVIQAFNLTNNFTGPLHPNSFMSKSNKNPKIPDVVVVTTCEFVFAQAPKRFENLLKRGETRLVCVVHHADQWSLPDKVAGIKPWVDKGLAEFWTLSNHTATFLRNETSKWDKNQSAPIRVFVPVFPVTSLEVAQSPHSDLSFAIQGNYDPTRRNYKNIFQRLRTFLHEHSGSGQNVSMHLLGHGRRPSVPQDVRDHVYFDEGLSYTKFYSVLSRVSAVLPGFASREYLDRKASSSVPAALIAGTPLVATQDLLDAYTYVDADSVWLQADGETDFDVVSRILAASPAQRAARRASARSNCERLVRENASKVGEWFQEAMYSKYCINGTDTR